MRMHQDEGKCISSAGGDGGKQKGQFVKNCPFAWLQELLQGLNVLSLPALGALDYVELNALAFLKRTEAVALDGGTTPHPARFWARRR